MKSPLKDRPLRNPGESLDEEIDRFLHDKALPYALAVSFIVLLTILEWYRWIADIEPNPYPVTSLALIVTPFCVFRIYRIKKHIRNLRLGRDGEKVVGQYLERIRSMGAEVFHDVPEKNFNLDHVVIASSGVYLIETKTYSKPEQGEATITFNGTHITMRGRGSYDAPVIQAKAGARWLRDFLKESTGREYPIRPVLLFPGWFIQPTVETKKSDLWVLNPKALPAFIQNSFAVLREDDVKLASYHLSRYIRTYKPS